VVSTPANRSQVDDLVSFVDAHTRVGDPILVMPDYPSLYYLADRPNATRQDWYFDWIITTGLVDQSVSDLRARPARLVLIQRHTAFDFNGALAPFDYGSGKLASLHSYVTANYRPAGSVGDVDAWAPPG
jgi:hypothetical protein